MFVSNARAATLALLSMMILVLSQAAPAAGYAASDQRAADRDDVSGATAGGRDWLSWGGPNGNFTVMSVELADSWPADGPPTIWRRPIGGGYSAIVVDGDRLFTMYRDGDREVVLAMSAATGETLWEHRYRARVRRLDTAEGSGPHASPLVVGDRLFTAGVVGGFHALDKHTGKLLWSHELWSEMEGTFRPRGYSSSPVAYGDTVIALVGGRGQALMAFDQADGSVVWRSGDLDNAQASPLIIDVEGQPQLVAFMVDHVAGYDPSSGQLLWRHPHRTDYGLNISTPVWGPDNVLFISSAYNGGSRAIRLSLQGQATRVEELWVTNQFRVHFGTAMRIGDQVYGFNGDFGPSFLTAIDVGTGKVLWRDRSFAKASFVYADGKLVLLDEDGDLGLVTVSRDGMEVLARASVMNSRAWTPPTLVGTTLYIRNRREIMALDLGPAANEGR